VSSFLCVAAVVLAGPTELPAGRTDLPPLNAAVVRFCDDNNGEQVGSGGCSEVAFAALAAAGAKRRGFDPAADENGSPIWGKRIDRAEDVLPGDIIQFHKVRLLDIRPNGTKYMRWYPEHTAIVARVRGGGVFDVYEQNVITAGADKKRRGQLRIRDLNLRGVLDGTITAYRPVARSAGTAEARK